MASAKLGLLWKWRVTTPHFAEGVYLAELAATSSPDYLPTTLAVALGFAPGDGTPSLDKLASALYERQTLLLLDNCEHLIESAAQMAERLLRIAPRATIIATSREALRVAGEYIYRVPSLEVPPDDSAEDARDFGAIRLFEERVGTDLLLCDEGARALTLKVRICRQARRYSAGDRGSLPLAYRPLGCEASPNGSTTDFACSRTVRVPPCRASRRCARRSTGATACCPRPSARCLTG